MPVRLNKNCIFYHCLLLSTSSVVLQLLGFGYRILLGRLAGAQAIAVYNLVMSAYNVVLSCTLTGVALSVSRIASGSQAGGGGRSGRAARRAGARPSSRGRHGGRAP